MTKSFSILILSRMKSLLKGTLLIWWTSSLYTSNSSLNILFSCQYLGDHTNNHFSYIFLIFIRIYVFVLFVKFLFIKLSAIAQLTKLVDGQGWNFLHFFLIAISVVANYRVPILFNIFLDLLRRINSFLILFFYKLPFFKHRWAPVCATCGSHDSILLLEILIFNYNSK